MTGVAVGLHLQERGAFALARPRHRRRYCFADRVDILPIDGANAAKLIKDFPFFAPDSIPAGTYKDVGAVKTVAVGAHWITSAKISADTVYAVTKALWSDKTRAALDAGHAKGKDIRKETALAGLLGVPLHPGAERFYREAGLLK